MSKSPFMYLPNHPSIIYYPSIYPCIHHPSNVTPCSLLSSASLWNTHTHILCSLMPHSPHLSIPPSPIHHPHIQPSALTHSPITCQSARPPLYLPTLSPIHPLTGPLIHPPSDYPDVGQSIYPSTYPSGHPSIHQLFSHRTKLSKL